MLWLVPLFLTLHNLEEALFMEGFLARLASAALPMVGSIDAPLRLIDALDQMDQLDAMLAEYHRRAGVRPESWLDLVRARWLPGIPVDPAGHPYELNATWSTTRLSPESPLNPLPTELAR